MRLIDQYVVKQFIVTTLFSLMAVIVIFVVIDAMEHLDDFIDKQATVPTIVRYYV
ncbi:MAG: LptF/LptG family permease, partial [Ignavibacteriae bacterium]|nr:LptF/LptG family permease [Ignavibacteriota bacterium]